MADCTSYYIDYKSTHFFNNLVNDYIADAPHLTKFYNHRPNIEGFKAMIAEKQGQKIDRKALQSVIQEQYDGYAVSERLAQNIDALISPDTFTICTAHQPNLMTGYAYFIYKIMHAIKLADDLKAALPEYNFVPVYYIGSEDDDLDELGTFKFNGKSYRWDTNQTGAVGRMNTADLAPLLEEFDKDFIANDPKALHIKSLLTYAYTHYSTITDATRYIVNELMGKYGIIVLDPDHAALKASYQQIISQEIFTPKAYELVQHTNEALGDRYKHQAFVRPINFFFLKDNIRERIEKDDEKWKVVNTDIAFTKADLEETIATHPEYFSPNVILRGLYQEMILPNVAFIGGGSEVAYWMQLKEVFRYYQVPFPILMLRQSIQFQTPKSSALQDKLGLTLTELFIPTEQLIEQKVTENTAHEYKTEDLKTQFAHLFETIKERSSDIDQNLAYSTGAALKKIEHQLDVLAKKFYKAEKKNQAILIDQIEQLKQITFPKNGLVERYETFLPEYLAFEGDYFQYLYDNIKSLNQAFLWIK